MPAWFIIKSSMYKKKQFGSGDFVAAKIDITDPDNIEVSKYFVAAAASNETREQPYSIVKDPNEDDAVYLLGDQTGNFEDEDVEDDGEEHV